MGSSGTGQRHLERRGTAYFWRRRWPRHPARVNPINNFFLAFSLRTHLPSDAKILASRLTAMSDQVFAAMAETTMGIPDEVAQAILVKLARFEIEAFDRARRIAPARSPEVAACDLAREAAVQDTLRRAIWLRDREVARAPLRHIGRLLGVTLQEDCEDWHALAADAARVLLEVSEERAHREQGLFERQSSAFRTALGELDHRSALATGYCNLAAPDLIRASSSMSLPLAPLRFASARAEAWDDRIFDFYRSRIFQGNLDEPGEPLFWAIIYIANSLVID